MAASDETPEGSVVRYRECLRNHGVQRQPIVLDGCGAFAPTAGDLDGSPESMACGCSRNFHRRVELRVLSDPPQRRRHPTTRVRIPSPPPPPSKQPSSALVQPPSPPSLQPGADGKVIARKGRRTRTKFTEEQKVRMRDFAEHLGWKTAKKDGGAISSFCEEIGVDPYVFKAWIRNNKHCSIEPAGSSTAQNN